MPSNPFPVPLGRQLTGFQGPSGSLQLHMYSIIEFPSTRGFFFQLCTNLVFCLSLCHFGHFSPFFVCFLFLRRGDPLAPARILHLPPRIVRLPSRLVGRTQCCANQRIALAHRSGPWQARLETSGFIGAKIIGKGGSTPLPPGKRIFFAPSSLN